MKALAEALQVLAALMVMLAAIYAGIYATTVFAEISRGLKQDRLYHEHMLKEHQVLLKDHERMMQR